MRRPLELPGWFALGAGVGGPIAWLISEARSGPVCGTLSTLLAQWEPMRDSAACHALHGGLALGVVFALGRSTRLARRLRRLWTGPASRAPWKEGLRGAALGLPLALASLELGWLLHDHLAHAFLGRMEQAVEDLFPLIEPCGAVAVALILVSVCLGVSTRLERLRSPVRSRRLAQALLGAALLLQLGAGWCAFEVQRVHELALWDIF